MKTRAKIFMLFVLWHAAGLLSQVDPRFDARLEKHSHTFQNTTLPYRLYIPEDYSAQKSYPVLIFLHGARWAGTDNITQLDNELALYWMDSTFQDVDPCFLVYPQIPGGQSWEPASGQVDEWPASPNLETANDIITKLLAEYSIDENRIIVCGKSIGALGVYGIIARYPDRYAAAIPAAGRYVYQTIEELSKCSLWIFHNRDDTVVPISQSRFIVEQIGESFIFTHCNYKTEECDSMPPAEIDSAIQNGARFMLSEFNDTGHQLEPNVVTTHGLYHWAMQQRKTQSSVQAVEHLFDFRFFQNYPNPFNSSTTIHFSLLKNAHIRIAIRNVKGQTVVVLKDGFLQAGSHSYVWHAENNPSGIYFYEVATKDAVHVGRCLVLK